ncbi:MAG: molybdopterin converting factor subunit 1 [Rhodospirillaceae bacterium]|nr:molybdopterin converting factor subunit 1 [Magnetovibrio sp.]MAY66086.1 molybdopterin converting factor subunit 1 [Rhodospirillaceae bacterium]
MTAPVKLLYFAWLREKAGVGEEDVQPPATVATVAQLIDWLETQGGGRAEAFADRKVVRVAVNQEYVSLDHPVTAGDEVAFFPPVTGG